MLDVAIVGGGLCGLALAHSVQAAGGLAWQLFEARPRLGGRLHTAHAEDGTPLDLGATWFWPHNQPAITRLVKDLGLHSIEQVDDGRVLHLSDPNRAPEAVALTPQLSPAPDASWPATPGAVHGGARRVVGGAGAIVASLAHPLPAARLCLGHSLVALTDHGDHVALQLQQGEQTHLVLARRVVLALPPRVLAQTVRFSPELPEAVLQAMRNTPTWMATAAKAAFAYRRAFWQDKGHTGNAWVSHQQAMLAEVFDACGPTEGSLRYPGAALAGFAALGASQREQFARGRDILLESQIVQLFGAEAMDPAMQMGHHWQDWATEAETCTPLDIAEEGQGPMGHPQYGAPLLTDGHWDGRLWFGGSETARQGGGYMEGALSAAGRLRKQVLSASAAAARPREAANESRIDLQNAQHLERFAAWVRAERGHALQRYRERLHQALSRQDDAQLTQKAVLGTLESLYEDALDQLGTLPLSTSHLPVEQGRHGLTPKVLAPFKGMIEELLAEVVKFNNTSCALSNFPFEHRPNRDYLQTIRLDIAATWQAFAMAVNARLLGKLPEREATLEPQA
jgi:monoamine oxidase